MARKNTVVWTSLDAVSMAVDQTSAITDVQQTDHIGIALSWSGTAPNGEFFVEVSNDTDVPNQATWIWTRLDFGAQILITTNSGSHVINLNFVPFAKIRVAYDATSGTGALTARLTMKQSGG